MYILFFFFNDTATTEIYTLSLHDALPIYRLQPQQIVTPHRRQPVEPRRQCGPGDRPLAGDAERASRSEEHTSELQSHLNLVCRLLLEKKKNVPPRSLRDLHTQTHLLAAGT